MIEFITNHPLIAFAVVIFGILCGASMREWWDLHGNDGSN